MKLNKKMLKNFLYFIEERERVRENKEAGFSKPWTKDPILQQYKFCNVHREDDRVSIWITKNWRLPHTNDPNFWFAAAVARYINWPDTLEQLGYPHRFSETNFINKMNRIKQQNEKLWTGAYMISTHGAKMSKIDYVAGVLGRLWKDRKKLTPLADEPLFDIHARLKSYYGVGSFMSGQIIADAKYTIYLAGAPDWDTFAVSGPGSRRGLNRVCGRDKNAPWKEEQWYETLLTLWEEVRTNGPFYVHCQDLQNCLCEFDKYRRVKNGEGRPRSTYPGEK